MQAAGARNRRSGRPRAQSLLPGARNKPMSHFFAYLARMKFIRRWGLMRSQHPENVQEHSLQVAMIAHALALVRNELFGGRVNAERVAVLAMFHDASEVVTGDLPTPVKYHSRELKTAYRAIEATAQERLLDMAPTRLRPCYEAIFSENERSGEMRRLVKAADAIAAYLKCVEERAAGNSEFSHAMKALEKKIAQFDLPEVRYFMDTCAPSFALTLDELNAAQEAS